MAPTIYRFPKLCRRSQTTWTMPDHAGLPMLECSASCPRDDGAARVHPNAMLLVPACSSIVANHLLLSPSSLLPLLPLPVTLPSPLSSPFPSPSPTSSPLPFPFLAPSPPLTSLPPLCHPLSLPLPLPLPIPSWLCKRAIHASGDGRSGNSGTLSGVA